MMLHAKLASTLRLSSSCKCVRIPWTIIMTKFLHKISGQASKLRLMLCISWTINGHSSLWMPKGLFVKTWSLFCSLKFVRYLVASTPVRWHLHYGPRNGHRTRSSCGGVPCEILHSRVFKHMPAGSLPPQIMPSTHGMAPLIAIPLHSCLLQ